MAAFTFQIPNVPEKPIFAKKPDMKKLLLIFALFGISLNTFSQDTLRKSEGELYLSVNRTMVGNEYIEDKFGYGLGFLFVTMPEKELNVVMGIEFNRTSQFISELYESKYGKATDMTYFINFISLPLALRLNLGEQKRFFIETGLFADLLLGARREGTLSTFSPGIPSEGKHVNERARLNSTYGMLLGIGFRVPVSSYELIIKSDFKAANNPLHDYQDQIHNRYLRLSLGINL